MGLLDSIIGSVLGGAGGGNAGGLQSVLGSILNSQGGISGLVEKMNQAGLGQVASSWIGNGPNQPVDPHSLGQVFPKEQIDQWAQQTGMSHDGILGSLSKLLPHAVDQATPNGVVAPGESPFDGAGTDFDGRR